MRGATPRKCPWCYVPQFQSTPPMRGATLIAGYESITKRFQSTPPMRGATAYIAMYGWDTLFQSTPPMRGATRKAFNYILESQNFNPRPPCGERRFVHDSDRPIVHDFNPRPPCGERRKSRGNVCCTNGFQSTPPMRGATTSYAD